MSPTEPIKEKGSNEIGEHVEALAGEVTYLSLSGDDDFSGKTILEIFVCLFFFLVGANTEYGRAVRVNSSCTIKFQFLLVFPSSDWLIL